MTASPSCRNMVEQQIRPWEVLDDRILDTYYEVSRDAFMPAAHRALAFADTQLPIGHGQVALEPKVEARILQELAPQANETILHVGTGSGCFAALLSRLAATVVTVEREPDLAAAARERLAALGITNATVITGDAFDAATFTGAPFDAGVLTGSVPLLPAALFTHLTDTGRLVAPLGTAPVCTVTVTRRVNDQLVSDPAFDTWVPPLANAPAGDQFRF